MAESMKPTQSLNPVEILLVEDDDDDVRLMTTTFKRDRIYTKINRVEDGVEAIEYLRREGKFAQAQRPDLILLDLNLPRKDGREVLKEVKEDPKLRDIPVVVLTTSDDELDIMESYQHQANSYVTKPVDLLQFRKMLQTLQDYWFSVVKIPSRDN